MDSLEEQMFSAVLLEKEGLGVSGAPGGGFRRS